VSVTVAATKRHRDEVAIIRAARRSVFTLALPLAESVREKPPPETPR